MQALDLPVGEELGPGRQRLPVLAQRVVRPSPTAGGFPLQALPTSRGFLGSQVNDVERLHRHDLHPSPEARVMFTQPGPQDVRAAAGVYVDQPGRPRRPAGSGPPSR